MRVWDLSPGYLSRQSLLGEHRELHGVASIHTKGRKGYSRHPETLRWKGLGWAMARRHHLLAAEMALRGYCDRSPLLTRSKPGQWPENYLDSPADQFRLLAGKYADGQQGRIPLPAGAQELWSQHKYSVMARDPAAYREIGRRVAGMRRGADWDGLALELTEWLRRPPSPARLRNTLQHMWGHVSEHFEGEPSRVASWQPSRLLAEIQRLAREGEEPYLSTSTALGELAAWLR